MKSLVAAGLLFLCSSMASAESLQVGSMLEWNLRQVCHSQQSAHEVMAVTKTKGRAAGVQLFQQKSDCGPRILSFTVLRVVEEVEISPHLTIRMLELENWAKGIFYGFTSKED